MHTERGIPGRICCLNGTIQEINAGLALIMENISRLETSFNGIREVRTSSP